MENEGSASHQGKKIEAYIIGDSLKRNGELTNAIKSFHLPVTYSSDGRGLLNPARKITPVYVLEEFEGDIFTSLQKSGLRILGPTIVMQCAQQNEDLPSKSRPLYSTSMRNVVLTFTGFRSKDEVTCLYNLARYMFATVRKDFSMTKTTHLVAAASAVFGEKYKFAATGGIPVMTKDWIYQAWARRHDVNSNATDTELMQFKLLPFIGCKLAFLGYPPEEQQHMEEVCTKNGGEVVEPKEPSCTHIVVEDKTFVFYSEYNRKVNILKNEWFWACLQLEARAEEKMYVYENANSVCVSSSVVMPEKGSKRERLECVAQQLAAESLEHDFYCTIPDFYKIDDKTLVADSFEDILSQDSTDGIYLKSPPLKVHTLTPRQQISLELFQTESNYVAILHTIMTLFKEQIEKPNKVGGPLLTPTETKLIFGNLPPIYEVHLKIHEGLAEIVQNRKEHGIGNVILRHAFELLKSYPPFVNFFEESKKVLAVCDATKPRFHAFLKCCQSKPECGRQTLKELLIRPVQRLPSIILLLNDLLKHTTKGSIDYQILERSIQAVKDVLKHINEDKRKTEGQIAMFEAVNDIENCPPNLLSSHRTLISKTDVLELTDLLSSKGNAMTLLLFTDVLEICRKKNKVSDSRKDIRKSFIINPGSSSAVKDTTKCFKHIELISLSHIKRVVDINETTDCENSFAIVFWSSTELKELLYAFQLENDSKSVLLRTLCNQIAHSLCKPEAESLLTTLDPEQLGLVGPESKSNTLSKALKKTQNKLGSSWSLKSSSKLSLSKAISTFFDPWKNFGEPSNKMTPMKLQSFDDLTVLEPSCSTTKSPPARRKKRKSSSFTAFQTNA